jgi:hypothetical protein
MPNVKVCLWNIQNYGQESGRYNGAGLAVGNALRNRFIARFVHANAIDVLLIQEVNQAPETALKDLRTQLNALYAAGQRDWRVSWCGSAIAHRDTDEATTAADIIYRTGARTEGYAVVWRAARATFRMIRGLYPIADGTTPSNVRSPLNISQRGRPTGNNRIGGGREKFSATGGFRRVHTLPYDYDDGTDDYQLMAAWPKLNYPATSKYDAMGIQWEKARRPAYVVLKLADAHDTLCPVGVYHAPSNQVRSSWGAFMSGLARELYAVNGIDAHDIPEADQLVALTKCVFGGDFNWSQSQASWPGEYEYFTRDRNRNYRGGAQCSERPLHTAGDAARRTTVQIVEGVAHDQPITGPNTADYLRHKIDLVFYPTGSGITAQRIDLLNELLVDGARLPANRVYSDPLEQTDAYLAHMEAQVANPFNYWTQRLAATGPQEHVEFKPKRRPAYKKWLPVITGAWGGTFTNWATTRAQFGAGAVTDARRAAEFTHIFISDHLPLVATIPT